MNNTSILMKLSFVDIRYPKYLYKQTNCLLSQISASLRLSCQYCRTSKCDAIQNNILFCSHVDFLSRNFANQLTYQSCGRKCLKHKQNTNFGLFPFCDSGTDASKYIIYFFRVQTFAFSVLHSESCSFPPSLIVFGVICMAYLRMYTSDLCQ